MTRHSAGQKDRQFPLVGLPARALRCVPRHREERAQLPAHACGPGLEGHERRASDAPRPPGRFTLEDMAALWCPGQVPAVRLS